MTSVATTLSPDHLVALRRRFPHFFRGINAPIALEIMEGDGMLEPDNEEYYLLAGLWVNWLVDVALQAAGRPRASIGRILDFACGYGRVARILAAAFPDAVLTAMDADKRAVAAVGALLKVHATATERDFARLSFTETYDLIWVGSLFTHIGEEDSGTLLAGLANALAPGGLLVLTTHGNYVAARIGAGEKLYGLDPTAASRLTAQHAARGIAFEPYPTASGYGIAVVKPAVMLSLAQAAAAVHPVLFMERGWVRHQDVFCFRRD